MPAISLYWFAAQQKTSRYRLQKSHFIYSKFSVEWSELTPSFQNRNRKWLKNIKNQTMLEKRKYTYFAV